MRTIALATTNRHKAAEIAAILETYGLVVEVPAALPPVIEDGDTFAANALLKAASAARALGQPALSDDSGLVVPALGGEPGVHSARYAGEHADSAANNALLVERLEARGLREAEAAFVCHAVVADPEGHVVAEAEGRVEGIVRWPGKGRAGFGYDPLFHHPPSGMRFAELPAEAKNAVSHRALALRAVADKLRTA
jgi:XTP/dITP diphosphohydrolase